MCSFRLQLMFSIVTRCVRLRPTRLGLGPILPDTSEKKTSGIQGTSCPEHLPSTRLALGKKTKQTIWFSGSVIYNSLPPKVKGANSLQSFKMKLLRRHFFHHAGQWQHVICILVLDFVLSLLWYILHLQTSPAAE